MRILLTAAALLVLATPGLAASPASDLTLTLNGLKSAQGQVVVALFDSEAAFKSKAAPVRTATAPAQADRVEIAWRDLPPGRYAAVAYHDRNADGRLNVLPIGLPTEPYAISNDAPARFGPPAWKAAVFEVHAGENRHVARLR